MSDIERMRQLAGLREPDILPPDNEEDDRLDDERRAREAKIIQLITMACQRLGLSLAFESPVCYDEEADREARVRLDDSGIDLDHLLRLKQTGLADQYSIEAGANYALDIVFRVGLALDHTV